MAIILYYSRFSRQIKAITIRVYRQTDTQKSSNSNTKSDFKELAHVTIEAGKSQD